MAQVAEIKHGTFPSLTGVVNETNLKVRSVGMKPSRDKKFGKNASSGCTDRAKYIDPKATFTIEADITAQSGLGSLGVGKAVSGGIANFGAVWREHDPSEGKLILDEVDDKLDIESDVPITTTLIITHYPFITT